jgi:hypothetical protein
MWDHLNFPAPLVCFAQATPENHSSVMQILSRDPWIIVVGLALLIPIVAITFGTITEYLRKIRVAEIEAALKREMLERGMTPEQIKLVVEASTTHKSRQMHGNCTWS